MKSAFAIAGIALALALLGCTTVQKVTGPDGKPALKISCFEDEMDCYEEASGSCNGRFKVLQKKSDTDFIVKCTTPPSNDTLVR